MDGLELAKWLSQTHAGTKVVLLTAFADFTYAQQAIEYGVSNYVTKTGNMGRDCHTSAEPEPR